MFTIQSEPKNIFSRLILSEATFGIFGVAVLIVMLFFAFAGTVSEEEKLFSKRQSAKPAQTKPVAYGVVAKNLAKVRK